MFFYVLFRSLLQRGLIILACSNPLYRYDKIFKCYRRIPCRWCMSCRIDRRNYYEDMLNWSFTRDFQGVGCFVTITYDDFHIPTNPDGDMYSLCKTDVQLFMKRLRSYIKYHRKELPEAFVSSKFKFFCAGEYGEFLRPHYHFIFTGIDFSVAGGLFRKVWHDGSVIDVGPILNGGIRYVLKYLDKQNFGDALDSYYDEGIEPPFVLASHCIAPSLFSKENINFNKGTYRIGKKERPLPQYIKDRYLIETKFSYSDEVQCFADKNNMSYDEADNYLREAKERNMESRALSQNEPVWRVSAFNKTRKAIERPCSIFDISSVRYRRC